MTFNELGNGAADSSIDFYKVLRIGDIAFEGHTNKEFRYGRFGLNDIGSGIMSPRFTTLRPITKQEFTFWKYYIHDEKVMRQKLVCSTKAGTMMNELVIDDLMRQSILVPSLSEQKKTGDYFKGLDYLLSLHQRKLEKLKILKKAMLEKMFPKNGAKVPEIRFSGFTYDWEQRKFSALVIRESIIAESREGLPSVEYEDVIAEEGVLNKDLRTKMMKKQGVVFFDTDVLYGKLRPYLHNWLMPAFDGVAVGDWWVLRPIGVDRSFLYRSIQTQKFDEIANQSSGSKMPRADWKLISETEFEIPVSLEEQKAVGNYFERVDSLLSLHQRKLEKLRQIKKSMLERMFV